MPSHIHPSRSLPSFPHKAPSPSIPCCISRACELSSCPKLTVQVFSIELSRTFLIALSWSLAQGLGSIFSFVVALSNNVTIAVIKQWSQQLEGRNGLYGLQAVSLVKGRQCRNARQKSRGGNSNRQYRTLLTGLPTLFSYMSQDHVPMGDYVHTNLGQ